MKPLIHGRRARAAGALAAIGLAAAILALLPVNAENLRKDQTLRRRVRAWRIGARYIGDAGVVFQPRKYDCGAAALKMVLADNGIAGDLDELEKQLETTDRGTSMRHLREVATRSGLPARSW